MTDETSELKIASLRNHTCPYCGVRLTRKETERDHVIATNLVPAGKLKGYWNLILNVCKPCHRRKSELEDDISAITLQPEIGKPHEDPDVATEAERKGRGSVSRQTGKPVARSEQRGSFSGSLGPGGSFTVSFIGPPQLEDERVHELARFHVLAFFYFITYDEATREGKHPPGVFMPVDVARRSDWGNPIQRAFDELTGCWPMRFALVTADGYFAAMIRRNMPADLWSFALEWNRSLRSIGFFGDQALGEKLYDELSKPELHIMARDKDTITRGRADIPLPADEDTLFRF